MKKITQLLLLFCFAVTFAQPGSLDLSFNQTDAGFGTGSAFDANVNTCQIQPDGKIIFAGGFTTYNGVSKKRIVRLLPSGNIDATFTGTGFNSDVYSCKLLPNGQILVSGEFLAYNTLAVPRVIRLNADGTRDNSFNPSITGIVNNLSIQTDGKIILTGNFQAVNGVSKSNIARLNANGTLDTTFNTGSGFNVVASKSYIQPDGKIFCIGAFTQYNGLSANRIIKLNIDGSVDTSFNYGTGFNNTVTTIEVQSDSKIIVGGGFTSYNGISRQKLVRLNPDGSPDLSVSIQLLSPSNLIWTMLLDSDGKLTIGGTFTSINGTAINRIARLNTDWTLDTTFTVGQGANADISLFTKTNSGKLLVTGSFTTYNNVLKGRMVSINANGSIDNTFNPQTGADDGIWSICKLQNGKNLLGGDFGMYNGLLHGKIVKIQSNGEIDDTFNTGSGANFSIYDIVEKNDKYFVTGSFTTFNEVPTNYITKLNSNGSTDLSFNAGIGANSSIFKCAVQNDGKIIIVGLFTSINNIPQNRIARLNSNGSLDTTFATGVGANNTIEAVIIQPDGKIVFGGNFTSFNGVAKSRIARLNADGTIDTTFTATVNNNIFSTILQNDGKILIGGQFTTVNSLASPRIARLNTDGTLDTTFNVGTGSDNSIFNLAVTSDNKILVGGNFQTFNQVIKPSIVQLNSDGAIDATFLNGTSANASVTAISVQNDQKILIGGYFTSYNEVGRNRIARIQGGSNLGITTNDVQKFQIYPNPSTGIFTIQTENPITSAKITVADLNGRIVHETKSENLDNKTLDLSNLQNGIYILNVSNGATKYSQKIIKQ